MRPSHYHYIKRMWTRNLYKGNTNKKNKRNSKEKTPNTYNSYEYDGINYLNDFGIKHPKFTGWTCVIYGAVMLCAAILLLIINIFIGIIFILIALFFLLYGISKIKDENQKKMSHQTVQNENKYKYILEQEDRFDQSASNKKLSIGKIQRKYNIGFNYAKNIMDGLYENNMVGKENGYYPRELLCEESIVWEFIEENFEKYRPDNYNFVHGYGNNGGDHYKNIANEFDGMEGHEFEYFCANLLEKNGFEHVEVTKGSADHGIDILAEKDGITYAIQCKCYSSNIGNASVQQALTGKAFYKRDIAVVMTNRYFTSQAIEEAETLGVKLWNRDKLNSMIND